MTLTTSVHSRPTSKAPQAAVKTPLQPAEEIAKKICLGIVTHEFQAVSSGNMIKFREYLQSKQEDLRKLSSNTSNGIWSGLARELSSLAAAHAHNGFQLNARIPLPTAYKDPQEIKAALKNAYDVSLLNQRSSEVIKCLEAAKKAIDSLPKSYSKSSLLARYQLYAHLILKKNQPAAPAPKKSIITLSAIIKTALFVIAANSVLHGLGIMPDWTRFATVQGIYGLATSGISSFISNTGANDAAAQALKKAKELESVAVQAAKDASSETWSFTAGLKAKNAFNAAKEASKIAQDFELSNIAKDFPEVHDIAKRAHEAYVHAGTIAETLKAAEDARHEAANYYSFSIVDFAVALLPVAMLGSSAYMQMIIHSRPVAKDPSFPTFKDYLKTISDIGKAVPKHPVTKASLIAIAANSILHGLRLVPTNYRWTNYATFQASLKSLRQASYFSEFMIFAGVSSLFLPVWIDIYTAYRHNMKAKPNANPAP